jgi:peptide-methionine (S)-S-oxide reductase
MEKAMFAAGCFWGVEAVFSQLKGVKKTTVGYTGGYTDNPTYDRVCTGATGHAESVLVEFDPKKITYQELLQIFFENHDPTQLNKQGPDIGSQYRSTIFYFTEKQKHTAMQVKTELVMSKKHSKSVVTQIEEAKPFYLAEEYHQKYLEKKGLTYCHI